MWSQYNDSDQYLIDWQAVYEDGFLDDPRMALALGYIIVVESVRPEIQGLVESGLDEEPDEESEEWPEDDEEDDLPDGFLDEMF